MHTAPDFQIQRTVSAVLGVTVITVNAAVFHRIYGEPPNDTAF
jgi:hypothetical protein